MALPKKYDPARNFALLVKKEIGQLVFLIDEAIADPTVENIAEAYRYARAIEGLARDAKDRLFEKLEEEVGE